MNRLAGMSLSVGRRMFGRFWNPRERYQGLQIMMVGFIIVFIGGLLSAITSVFRRAEDGIGLSHLLTDAAAVLSFVVLGVGMAIAGLGIVLHWIVGVFSVGSDQDDR